MKESLAATHYCYSKKYYNFIITLFTLAFVLQFMENEGILLNININNHIEASHPGILSLFAKIYLCTLAFYFIPMETESAFICILLPIVNSI